MNLPDDTSTQSRTTLVQTSGAAAALLLCVGLVVWLAWLVLREIDDFSVANSDNLQWSLAQADVEFLQFRLSMKDAQDNPAAMEDVRRRFDIFYSRMVTMSSGRVFHTLRESVQSSAPRMRVLDFLENTVPLIDGPDEEFLAELPDLLEQSEQVTADVRAFSLAALSAFAEVSDARREGITELMIYIAAVLLALFIGLTLLAYAMFRLFRLAQKRADALQFASTRMKTIVQTSPNAIVVTDEVGVVREFNTAAEALFGYTRAEAVGRLALELMVPAETLARHQFGALAFLDEHRRPRPEEQHFEITLQTRDLHLFPAEVSADRAEADNALYVFYIRDISNWKEAEEQLTEARDRALAGERTKSEFLAVMSHEMRTPLNGLLGAMQLMRDHSLSPRQGDLLDRMQSSGRLLLELVNDVLDLAKFEAGKMKAEEAPFSINRLLDGLVETAQPLAQTYGNELNWRWCGVEGGGAIGDARRLRQVLLNLVGNALKFTRDGSVEVEVEYLDAARTEVEFRVIDNGIGIAEKDLARIFQDFETLDSSYAREAGGTGLGLGIARRFMRLMGGEIGAESEPGEGSLFWIRVPLTPVADVEADPEEPRDCPGKPKRPLDVLLVEDNEINRFIVREMLEGEGHSVTIAENGQAGVDTAALRRFDAILMDISMPIMDGTTAASHIRGGTGACAAAPIIALTAHALPEERERFRKVGMSACLTKPIERPLLLRTLAQVISGEIPAIPEDGPQAASAAQASAAAPAVTSAPASQSDLLDEARLGAFLSEVPRAAAGKLLERFFAEMDRNIAALAETSPEDPDLAPVAHQCAGSCGPFGVEALRRALGRIETQVKTGTLPEPAELEALADLWQQSRSALEARLEAA
ncbi:PAS domain S-box-containing protein [Alloyangia pacifica]|uniref:histidine kinase n=1 Tax=Alloyangia pacifica TaxID=311180 RepID=A0A1I6TLS8_9RHOB|nr:PAS domain S-box-containing protein [Alloyangia pacifica]SFS90088.1 PAS domain S-box-containing protein [Alloyangia pacifica]